MDTQQTHAHRRTARADSGPWLRPRGEQRTWRLTADGLDLDAAVAVLRERRPLLSRWHGVHIGSGGSITLTVPGPSQNVKFRGRIHREAAADAGGDVLLVSGGTREPMSVIALPLLFGVVTLMMLGVAVFGALTAAVIPLVLGLVAAAVMGMMAVHFRRSRGEEYKSDARELFGELETLMQPLGPEVVDGTAQPDRA